MAIGEKSEKTVATISSSFASTSTSTSSKAESSSLFRSVLFELDGLFEKCSSFVTTPIPRTSFATNEESNLLFHCMPKWKCWWLRPTIEPINTSRENYSSSFGLQQNQKQQHHSRLENNEVHRVKLHCRHPRHHHPFSSVCIEKLNSLTLHLTAVLVFTAIFACFPSPVGSSTTGEDEELVCMKGISRSFPGATFPRGDIFLKAGSTLEVFCKLNLSNPDAKGYNASNINFVFTKVTIPRDKVAINTVNETTAVVRVKNMNVSSPFLVCELKRPNEESIPVCQNQIEVGYPPLPVENFRCISKEWRSLNCSWDLPTNPIRTTYTLTKLWRNGQTISCPNSTSTPSSCTWDGRTEPHYRPVVDPLHFRLNGTNALMPSGTTWTYSFKLGSIVIPEKPKIEKVEKLSAAEYMVNWTFPNYEYFRYILLHKLQICCEYEQKCNETIIQTKPVDDKMTPYVVRIIKLPHANANYSISVRLRSAPTNDTEEFWSEPDIVYNKTDAKAPDFPPETDVGSFENKQSFDDFRDVYIYWRSIPDYLKNGPDFRYEIEVYENQKKLSLKPVKIGESYALFQNLSIRNSYHFNITSVNAVGRSKTSSKINVPGFDSLPEEPKSVSKVDFTNGSFEVSWRRPDRFSENGSYTVFRCASKRPRPYPCEGRLEWDRLDATEILRKLYSNLEHHSDRQYEFAVSANTGKLGSGMVWATCTLFHNKVPERLRFVKYKEVSDEEILITWDLECSYKPGDIEGFKITYCQVEKLDDEKCKDGESSVAVEGENTTMYRLVKLKPFSVYKVYVSILSAAGESPKSDPMYPKTLEGAPSSPKITSVSRVTNVSALLSIDPPQNPNGKLLNYIVYYQAQGEEYEQELRVKLKDANETKTEQIILKNLSSNSNYSVQTKACTSKCSGRSEPFYFVTDIGRTDIRTFPSISWKNGHIHLEWDKPGKLSGPVEYFEVLLKKNGEKVDTEEDFPRAMYLTGKRRFDKDIPQVTCEPSTNFTAQVRAVTKLESGHYLYGAWSPPGNYSCGGETSYLIWIILVVVIIVAAAVFGILVLRFYGYLKRMKDSLTIKLPPGLNSELNGFGPKPPPRGRSNENLYGKEPYAYPLQPTSTQGDESKDFLSSSDLNQGEAEDSLNEKPLSPSPTNPLLARRGDGSNADDDEKILLTDFGLSREDKKPSSPPKYKKSGGNFSNGSAVAAMEMTPGPSSRSTPTTSRVDDASSVSPSRSNGYYSPNHFLPNSNTSPVRNDPAPPITNGVNRAVPDVLSSSPASPSSLNSNSSLPGSIDAPSPPPPVAPAPVSSSYVKWTALVPDMKTGEAGGVLENGGNKQAPYCHIGILLDS